MSIIIGQSLPGAKNDRQVKVNAAAPMFCLSQEEMERL
jgi:hypothetical protein